MLKNKYLLVKVIFFSHGGDSLAMHGFYVLTMTYSIINLIFFILNSTKLNQLIYKNII